MFKEYIFVIVAKKVDVGHYHHTFLVNIKKVNPKFVQKVVKILGKITLNLLPFPKVAYMNKKVLKYL